MEALTNIAIGFGISTAANIVVLPWFGLHPSFGDAIGIGLAMTVVSVVRQYLLRRAFNGRSVWAAIRAK